MKSSFQTVVKAVDKLYTKKKFPTLDTGLIQVKKALTSHGWEMSEYASLLTQAYKEGKL
jgi:hypothetical protein